MSQQEINYAQEFQQMIQYLTEHNIEFKAVLDGPFYNKKYSTILIKIYAPDDSAIDLDHMSVVLALKLTDPQKKPKVAFIIKNANVKFLEGLQEQFDNLKLSLPNKMQHLNIQFDSFLLTQFQYFDRYQTTDQDGVTVTRYILKEITTKEQIQKDKEEEKERKKQEQLEKQKEKQEYEKQQWDKQNQLKELALQAKKQKQIDEQDEESSENIFTEAVYGNVKQYVNQKTNEVIQNNENDQQDNIEIILPKQKQQKTKYFFYGQEDFVSGKQLQKEQERIIRENKQKEEMKQKAIQNIQQQQSQNVKLKTIKMLTEEQNIVFRQLVSKLGQNTYTRQTIMLIKQHFNTVKILSEGEKSTIIFINFPCKFLPLINFKSENLQHLNLFMHNQNNYLPLLLSIAKNNPKNSFIRIDPNNNFLNKLDEFIKQHQQEAALYKQNLVDQQLLCRCSKILTQMLVKYTQTKLQDNCDLENKIDDTQYQQILQKLPKVFQNIELLNIGCFISEFMNNILPDVLSDVFDSAQKQLFDERVAQYYEQQQKEIQKEQREELAEQGKKVKQQHQEESSYSEESSSSIEEQEEQEESDISSSSQSNSSAFNNINTIRDNWLAHDTNAPARSINLKLFGLSMQNILVAQFVYPTISVMCSKCNKLLIQQIQLEPTLIKQQSVTVQSDILSGKCQCSYCQAQMSLVCQSLLFNQSTNGAALLVVSMKNCLPLSLGFIESSQIFMQCTNCSTIGYFTSLRIQGDQKYSCRCPMCFQRMILGINQTAFVLPTGEPVQIPGADKRQLIADAKIAKANQQNQFTSNVMANSPHGICKHYKHSFRWFKFPCGNIFPCDICHKEQCSCGKDQASIQICGFCNRQSSVQDVCPFCHENLTKKHTNGWQGGNGCRNKTLMSKKDDKKYKGCWKTRSNKDKRKAEQKHRGNKKIKKQEDNQN